MTGEFSEVSGAAGPEDHAGPAALSLTEDDFDLLADYVGGALTGTPAQDEVAGRIAADRRWRRAHDELVASMDTVRTQLAAWGHASEPMPADVADRLAVRLRDEPRHRTGQPAQQAEQFAGQLAAQGSRPAGGAVGEQRAGGGRLTAVPGEGSAARPRRRWPRWAAPLAAAAAVLAFCGFGLQALPQFGEDSNTAADSGGASLGRSAVPEAGQATDGSASALAALPVRQLVASGSAYRRDSVGAAGQALAADEGDTRSVTPERTFAGAAPRLAASDVDPALRRLTAPGALAACLSAIGAEHPNAATAVELVDYATFEGTPALIVVFVDASGGRWSWVAGPRCGLADAGAETRFKTRVR